MLTNVVCVSGITLKCYANYFAARKRRATRVTRIDGRINSLQLKKKREGYHLAHQVGEI